MFESVLFLSRNARVGGLGGRWIVGRDTVEARGGVVVRVPVELGQSTSAIVEQSRGG